MMDRSRKPDIMADAAHAILTRDARAATGEFYIDDAVLAAEGVSAAELERYCVNARHKHELFLDFFLEPEPGSHYNPLPMDAKL